MESKAYSIDEIKGKLHAAVDLIQGEGSSILITSGKENINMVAYCDDMEDACATLFASFLSFIDDLDEETKAMVKTSSIVALTTGLDGAECLLNKIVQHEMEQREVEEDAAE